MIEHLTARAAAEDLDAEGRVMDCHALQDTVHRYDTENLAPTGPALRRHSERVHDVVFSHRGRLLAMASMDGSSVVWDARTGDVLHRYAGGGLSVAFSADDRTLFTSGGAGLLEAWEVPGTSRQLVLGEDTGAVGKDSAVSLLAPDGHTVARVQAGRLSVVNSVTGRPAGEAAPTRDESFFWSPDSRWLLSVRLFDDGVVTVWDASDGSLAARRRFEGDVVAAFGQDPVVVHVYAGGNCAP